VAQLRVVPGGLAGAVDADRDSDRAMLARVVERDQAAHRVIFERYYKRVLAFVRRASATRASPKRSPPTCSSRCGATPAAYRGESPVTTWIFGSRT
jgi:hypothetical protein